MTDLILDHRTAAEAAALQLAVDAHAVLEATAEVRQHPGDALYRATVAAILPDIKVFAAAKNVLVGPDELPLVAAAALGTVSRRTMRGIHRHEADAVLEVQRAIDHVLDVLALSRFYHAVLTLEERSSDPVNVFAHA